MLYITLRKGLQYLTVQKIKSFANVFTPKEHKIDRKRIKILNLIAAIYKIIYSYL